jgi:hypothetical protein
MQKDECRMQNEEKLNSEQSLSIKSRSRRISYRKDAETQISSHFN